MKTNKKIGKYFIAYEFMCPCCGALKYDQRLIDILDAIREHISAPIIITSGFRCERHNREIGGSPNSKHLLGIAADITTPKMLARDLYKIVDDMLKDCCGVGYYPKKNILHIDTRQQRTRWYESKDGLYLPLTPEKEKVLGLR